MNYRGLDKETVLSEPRRGARLLPAADLSSGCAIASITTTATDVHRRHRQGTGRHQGRARARVSTADFDGDGWIDIYVANDGEDNLLWMNQKNGTFREVALPGGAAVTAEGKAEASMGVDAGDFDNDGDDDLLMTELTGQGINLYVNDGSARFRDQGAIRAWGRPARITRAGARPGSTTTTTAGSMCSPPTAPSSRWKAHEKVAFPYDQRRLLFRNLGNGRFEDVTAKAGASFTMSESGRGAAFGDVDNDGDIDILVGNDAGRARLLINNVGNRQHWVGLRLVGDKTPAGHARGAGRGGSGRRQNAVAARALRRQLCLRERSSGACRPGRLGDEPARAGEVARRSLGGMEQCGRGQVDHTEAGRGQVSLRFMPNIGVLPLAALIAAGCSRSDDGTTAKSAAVSQPATQAAPLPDLSKLVPSVQRQITTQYQVLTRTLADPTSTIIERANAYGELARLLMAAQLPDAAGDTFLNAQTLNPSDYRWPYYLAQLARAKGDLPKAASLFERVLQLKPDDIDTLVWLGDVSLAAGNPDAAEPAFARALQLNPGSVSARFGAGRTALARGDNRKAVEYLEEVLKMNPKATAAHYPLSIAYGALGDAAKSAEHLRQRRDGRVNPTDTLDGRTRLAAGEPPDLREPRNPGARRRRLAWRRGAVSKGSGPVARQRRPASSSWHCPQHDERRGGARAEFETAVQKSPEYFPAQFSLGVLLQNEGHARAGRRAFSGSAESHGPPTPKRGCVLRRACAGQESRPRRSISTSRCSRAHRRTPKRAWAMR